MSVKRSALVQLGTILIECMLLQVKYKEKYEKEKGRAMLDFETPSYVTAKEAQHMQSQVKEKLKSSTLSTPSLAPEALRRLLYINLN